MNKLIALLLTIGIVGCTEPPKPEKYGSYDWERIFFLDNRGISLLCVNNDDTVSFLLISEKEDWQDTGERMPGTFKASFAYIRYDFYDHPVYSYKAYEVYRSKNSHSDFEISPSEMSGFGVVSGTTRRKVKLDRELLIFYNQLRYGGDGNSYWSFVAQCEVSDNIKIAVAIDELKNRAKEKKMIALDQIRLEQLDQEKKNKL